MIRSNESGTLASDCHRERIGVGSHNHFQNHLLYNNCEIALGQSGHVRVPISKSIAMFQPGYCYTQGTSIGTNIQARFVIVNLNCASY